MEYISYDLNIIYENLMSKLTHKHHEGLLTEESLKRLKEEPLMVIQAKLRKARMIMKINQSKKFGEIVTELTEGGI